VAFSYFLKDSDWRYSKLTSPSNAFVIYGTHGETANFTLQLNREHEKTNSPKIYNGSANLVEVVPRVSSKFRA
jgi:hypothetical protein